MGNGEQYIWKPPEDEEMLMHQNKALGPLGAHTVENIQPSAAVVRDDSSVCASSACLMFGLFVLKLYQEPKSQDKTSFFFVAVSTVYIYSKQHFTLKVTD